MVERFRRSLELVRASWHVLRSDKELLVFPAVSFLLTTVVSIGFFVPFYLSGAFDETTRTGVNVAAIIVLFLYYLVTYTVIIFSNSALVGAAMIRLDGGDPTLRDGFRIALSRLPAIVGYALISATVGMILRAISERGGIVGQIAAGLIGLAWNIVTFLAVPVLVVEGVGPIEAVKRSGSLLRRTWGEQIVGNVGIGLVIGAIAFLAIVAGAALAIVLGAVSPVLLLVAILLVVIVVAGIALVGAALSGIFTASVYRYATKGDGGPMFPTSTLQSAFRPKS